jgi:glutamine synthetase
MKVFLEYIWLDGSQPQQLRSKTKIVDLTEVKDSFNPKDYPNWSFDGSSTKQAKAGKGENTDCVLKPVYITKDPFRGGLNKIILCQVFNSDGETPHETNTRYKLNQLTKELKLDDKLSKNDLPWFGWEQEYTLTTKKVKEFGHPFTEGEGLPLGFGEGYFGQPRPQGDYYCGTGADTVIGRDIVEKHMSMCVEIGLDVSGINAEVMLGQWEYQVGPVTSVNGSDQLWISRYILQRVAEKHGVKVSFHPKPMKGDWNGSGCHVNFSNKEMREEGGLEFIENTMSKLLIRHQDHINCYGLFNNERMTGEHETSSIHDFSYGYSTRDTSIRIPIQTKLEGKGYFEDRRPASNCDPYIVSLKMLETVYNRFEEPVVFN